MNRLTTEEKEHLARLRAALSPHNLTPKQFEILRLLASKGALTLAQIAEGAGIDQPQTSRLTMQLESAGWVKRQRDTEDYRTKVVALAVPAERVDQIATEIETQAPGSLALAGQK